MKMCPTLSISCCIFLLCLPAVTLVSVEKARSSLHTLGLPCCRNVITQEIKRIQRCFEQKPRYGCKQHAFLIINNWHKNKIWCIDPNSAWLKDKIEKGELKCPPVISA